MAIRFSFQSGNLDPFDAAKLSQWITTVVNARNFQVGNVSYLFCDDEYLLDVNQRYLAHDTYTDIITFDYVAGNLVSGDILISTERVKENAQQYSTSFHRELLRVIIHGILHLLGQGDKSEKDAAEMRRQEEASLTLWNDMFHEEQVA